MGPTRLNAIQDLHLGQPDNTQFLYKENGLRFKRRFSTDGKSPFDMVEYEYRTSIIREPDGNVVFEMKDIEIPKEWSQVATDIVAQKYFRKAGVPQYTKDGAPRLNPDGSPLLGPETSVRQTVHRLAGTWRYWGERYGYFASPEDAQIFYDELVVMLLKQMVAPNSPQWFNTGLQWAYGISGPSQGHYYVDPDTGVMTKSKDAYTHGQVHACFIQSVKDDLVNEGGIMDLWTREARIFKYGSGTGTNFSGLRGKGEPLSGGGKSSGLMSWLKIGDRSAGAIKSGGTTRRAAKMVILDLDHPDILEFVNWKVNEEKKVAAMIAAGYASDYESEAYQTVSGQNSNNSVRVPNKFMEAIERNGSWNLTWRTDGTVSKTLKAREMWDAIAYAAWSCADPGTQYDDNINEWHTCPQSGRINGSNPCVTGDTLITTDRGLESIAACVGEERSVKGLDGAWHPVKDIFRTGVKPVYELKTKSGYAVKLTADHKVFTENRGDISANELAEGDVVRLVHGNFGNSSCGGVDVAQLVGLLVGDGCIIDTLNATTAGGEQRRAAYLTMGKEEEHVVAWANGVINDMRPTLGEHNKQSAVTMTATTVRTMVGSPRILSLFEEYAILDEKSAGKRFTEKVFQLNKYEQAALVRGLFSADGTVANYGDKSQYVSLDSCSQELLKQVQLILLNFGIKAKLYENRRAGIVQAMLPDGRGGMKEYGVKEMYSLRVSRSSGLVFEKEIGFIAGTGKAEALRLVNESIGTYADTFTDAFDSLLYLGEEQVFDLTEPVTNHFTANGIAVHNCSEYMFLDDTACNLASLNLAKFFEPKTREFLVEDFRHGTRLTTTVLEISVLMAQYPSRPIAEQSYDFRTLGLGYANIGSVLMMSSIPYESDDAYAFTGCVSALMTAESYKTSAEIARNMGSFSKYELNKNDMLRVMRNHRRAAFNAPGSEYEKLTVKPVGIDPQYAPAYLLAAARESWNEAVSMGEQYGYRNAQTTLLAPTGTIGLLMDCATTGVEPDFALVKFKKLAGGGYFKIVNESVPVALKNLGYDDAQTHDIMSYMKGTGDITNAPYINASTLKEKGFTQEDVKSLNAALKSAFEVQFACNVWTLGEDCMKRLGFSASEYNDPNFNMLKALGFTKEQMDAANEYVCGTMTIEGAPHLKEEHYAVFDCANKCGKKGLRFIHWRGHIKQMGAAQPFLSGAISKTINMPNEATIEDVKQAYFEGWGLCLKAIAIYRDGCKLSQPLSTSSDKKDDEPQSAVQAASDTAQKAEGTADEELMKAGVQVVQAAFGGASGATDPSDVDEMLRLAQGIIMAHIPQSQPMESYSQDGSVVEKRMYLHGEKRRLPAKRTGITVSAKIGTQKIWLRTGEYPDGKLAEIFIDMYKEGAGFRSLLNTFAISISMGLQYGVPLEKYVEKFVLTRFEPAGMTDHPNVKICTSVIDWVFRVLAMEYLGNMDLVQVPPKGIQKNKFEQMARIAEAGTAQKAMELASPKGPAASDAQSELPTLEASRAKSDTDRLLESMMGDAPACPTCGHITVRNGSCYKCLNCGDSLGCS